MIDASVKIEPIERALLDAGIWCLTGKTVSEFSIPVELTRSIQFKNAIIKRSIGNKMLPMIAEFSQFQKWDLKEDIWAIAETFRIITEMLYQHISPIIEKLDTSGVQVLMLKGGDLAITTYPRNLPRVMNDLDLLVDPSDLQTAAAAFLASGYIQASIDRKHLSLIPLSDEEKLAIETDNYELAPFLKVIMLKELRPYAKQIHEHLEEYLFKVIGDDVFYVEAYDLHFNVSHDIEISDIWNNPRRIKLPTGQEVLAQSFTDLLWFLAARSYHEIMLGNNPCIRLFIDVAAVVHSHSRSIDWDRITFIADKYNLHPSLFYVFWHINELLGPTIPQKVIDFCCPARKEVKRFHDWGDFMPKLLGCAVVSPIR